MSRLERARIGDDRLPQVAFHLGHLPELGARSELDQHRALIRESFPRFLHEGRRPARVRLIVEKVREHIDDVGGLAKLAKIGLLEQGEQLVGLAGLLKRVLNRIEVTTEHGGFAS